MKFTTHPHKSDVLTITREELHKLMAGKELSVGAMYVRMEEEPKPDLTLFYFVSDHVVQSSSKIHIHNLALTFDGATGALKSAEVL